MNAELIREYESHRHDLVVVNIIDFFVVFRFRVKNTSKKIFFSLSFAKIFILKKVIETHLISSSMISSSLFV